MKDDLISKNLIVPPAPDIKVLERKEVFVTIGGTLVDKVQSVSIYFKDDKEEK